VSKYIHKITLEAAKEVASNLRLEDRREVEEGHGIDATEALLEAVQKPSCVYFTVPNGKTAGMAGVDPGGQIWMLCTPAIQEYPIWFARQSKRYVERQKDKLLWNVVDKRNTVHLKLLKFLGFKFLREVEFGPNKLSFIEFVRIHYGMASSISHS
tara:strand:+ start:6353 stop:6817 length:465 start_codon:yes stop_codon:yes gene_type:complete